MAQSTATWDPQNYFRAWERPVGSWSDLLDELENVNKVSRGRQLVWRGVRNASYGLLSSAYRWFKDRDAVVPSEGRMRELESGLLAVARTTWPDRGGSALETLAHIQHYGGPTRLIDVSHSPMIALFFATEQKYDHKSHLPLPDEDGRIFAFQANDRTIELNSTWGTRELPWLDWGKQDHGWETELPFVWNPPRALNERISAQQGAFLVGGVPSLPHGQNSRYRMPGAWQSGNMKTMPAKDVRQVTSVSMFLKSLERRTATNSQAAYTLRIEKAAKPGIREQLADEHGLHHGTVYPDRFGLASYGADIAKVGDHASR
ncbi:FRG domain-containing protein [Microbacterium aerolatum]|uniref:FRG domain protein n=1 Tax=Microbacterium aerolatum TaxID=153731 RepID=A0A511AHS2_9MICO|nr:FRG domain-containing protein [Microbacterium aerolatum]GEK87725.1 FRG domain protein [Microbacterium aerolatum]GGB33819.1 FRG domain protein [Microbacterium aerolatum]